jgi:hypothetical protein
VSAVATRERSRAEVDSAPRTGQDAPLFDDGLTLEDTVLGVWEDLVVGGSARCPVCGGSLTPDSCEGCGSELR